ncbi:MAG: hypothetical protein Q9174_001641 [Haloplaca sp. 1 TL-2023]
MSTLPTMTIKGQVLTFDQLVPCFMVSDTLEIEEKNKPPILLLLLWDLGWPQTKTLMYEDVQILLHTVRNPRESQQAARLRILRDLYDSKTKQWKEQEWERYDPVISSAPEMLEAVRDMDREDLEAVAFGLMFTNLSFQDVIVALQYFRQQRGLSILPAWSDRPDRLAPFIKDYLKRAYPSSWRRIIDNEDEGEAKWMERFREALKVESIPMKR